MAEVADDRSVERFAPTDAALAEAAFEVREGALLVSIIIADVCAIVFGFPPFPDASIAGEGLGVVCCDLLAEDEVAACVLVAGVELSEVLVVGAMMICVCV